MIKIDKKKEEQEKLKNMFWIGFLVCALIILISAIIIVKLAENIEDKNKLSSYCNYGLKEFKCEDIFSVIGSTVRVCRYICWDNAIIGD